MQPDELDIFQELRGFFGGGDLGDEMLYFRGASSHAEDVVC